MNYNLSDKQCELIERRKAELLTQVDDSYNIGLTISGLLVIAGLATKDIDWYKEMLEKVRMAYESKQ